MCVLAHPDDESLGTGGALAKSRGRGCGDLSGDRDPGRARPLRRQQGVAGAGDRRQGARGRAAGGRQGAGRPRSQLPRLPGRRARSGRRGRSDRRRSSAIFAASSPRSSSRFGPDGAYGHPDHIAISQLDHRGDRVRRGSVVRHARDRRASPRVQALLHRVDRARSGAPTRRRCASSSSRWTAKSDRRCRGRTGR